MDEDVVCLLRQWGLEAYITKFEENNITSIAMALLEPEDIKELICSVGHRVIFTKNLQEYKKLMCPEAQNNLVLETQFSQLSDITIDSASNIQEFPFNELISFTEAGDTTAKENDKKLPKESTEQLSLTELLERNLDGKALLSVPKNTPLDNTSRLRLVRLIGTYILQNQPERNITTDIYTYWTNEIVKLFTEEKRAVYLHTKLVESGRGIANRLVGKLPDQIHNLKRKYRESGLISKRPRRVSSRTPSPCPPSGSSTPSSPIQEINCNLENDTDCEENLQWLRNSSHPWATVEEKWVLTTRVRLLQLKKMTIADYFKEFPALKQPTGYLLLHKDFNSIYPENTNGLIEYFPTFKNRLFKLAANRPGKDSFIQNLLSLENSPEDVSNLAALLLIPSLLSVTTLRLKGTTKKFWRPSKAEVREAFITHVLTDADVPEAIASRSNKLDDFHLTLQPFIIAVGESLSEIKTYFVIVNEVKYLMPTILEAVDACLKIIFTLNAKYPEESCCTWMFIQCGFYKIRTPYDKTSTATNTLLSELGLAD